MWAGQLQALELELAEGQAVDGDRSTQQGLGVGEHQALGFEDPEQ
ncbi:hypothetical protein ACFU7X_02615 [Streptomyces chartreusis]